MIRVWLAFLALMTAMFGVFFAYQNPTISVPTGYRGTGQFLLYTPDAIPASVALNANTRGGPD